jgi:cobalamin biosynthesis protein CobT
MWFAASSLLACKEERKILIVLTDGAPDDPASALEALARCRASGIEDIGIGIYHDVKHLFKVPITINNMAELRTKLFLISRELLVA